MCSRSNEPLTTLILAPCHGRVPDQVLVYFAVAKKGDKPTDGKTDVNPEGLTAGGSYSQVRLPNADRPLLCDLRCIVVVNKVRECAMCCVN
jgi:hypothetical protein